MWMNDPVKGSKEFVFNLQLLDLRMDNRKPKVGDDVGAESVKDLRDAY